MQKRRKKSRISKKKQQRIRERNRRVLIFLLVTAALVAGITYALLYRYVNKTEETLVYDNIYIGPNKVGGMSEAEIKSDLAERLESYKEIKLELTSDDKSVEVSLGDLGLTMQNMEELAEKAVNYGKEGSVWKRFKEIRKLEKEAVVLEEQFVLADDAEEVLEKKTAKLERKAVDATIKHSGSGFTITEAIEGKRINLEESVEEIITYLNEGWEYEDAQVELVQEVEEPEIKGSDLESIQDVLGSFYTVAGGGTRLQNLERAAQLLNGTIVMPGEEISVEALTKPYTTDNGYVEGTAYENGQIVTSVGGGLCQVSTTLYNALLYAEVEIVERCAHSMQVNYVKPSRDAAIAEGLKDLRFKNNYDTPILIEGYVDGNNYLRFYIYGKETRPENRSVEYESEVVENTDYETKYVADTDSALGSLNTEGTGIDGMVAKLWKVVYEDGKEVERTTMNNSTYSASTVTVNVGVKSDSKEATELVEDAISTQKKSKIEKAIAKAQKLEASAGESEEEEE